MANFADTVCEILSVNGIKAFPPAVVRIGLSALSEKQKRTCFLRNVPDWFIGQEAAQPVWWHEEDQTLSTETDPPPGAALAAQVAMAARFDNVSSALESVRPHAQQTPAYRYVVLQQMGHLNM